MKTRYFVAGVVTGLSVGAFGVGLMLRELHHTRTMKDYYEEKEAKTRAHMQRRAAFEEELRSRRRRDDD